MLKRSKGFRSAAEDGGGDNLSRCWSWTGKLFKARSFTRFLVAVKGKTTCLAFFFCISFYHHYITCLVS